MGGRQSGEALFVVVMGVAGSGKTTIGRRLAARLQVPFYDGDDYHPPRNIAKMATDEPLDDDDRMEWLATLAGLIRDELASGQSGVITCSALKRTYRDLLRVDKGRVRFVYLHADYETILARLQARKDHFMQATLLPSQFAILEEPARAIYASATQEPDQLIDKILEQLMDKQYAVGIMGMGVMGRSLALNLERNGYPVIGYDPHPKLPEGFPVGLAESPGALAAALAAPRVILMMVPAGSAVDTAITSLIGHLEPGDILIDGGNSYFLDTERRVRELRASGIHFIGMGVSGGENGALWGPSLMPGGDKGGWEHVRPILEAIAARAADGQPMVDWMGPGGAGHYVKMVHNGIEYGDMELIAEVYDLLHRGAGLSNALLAKLFERWNEGDLRSYLIEITANVLAHIDTETGQPLVDLIMDMAGQKGTGRWTSQIALEVGSPTPAINAAVVMRLISAVKDTRVAIAEKLGGVKSYAGDVSALVAAAEQALYASKVTVYAQGIDLLKEASKEYDWALDIASIVRVWRAGCIIRAALLEDIAAAAERWPDLPHLYLDDTFATALTVRQNGWRAVITVATDLGIPLLALAAALGYFDAMRSARLPANLIQAQRDYFGAHTYHRVDREGVFHTEWDKA